MNYQFTKGLGLKVVSTEGIFLVEDEGYRSWGSEGCEWTTWNGQGVGNSNLSADLKTCDFGEASTQALAVLELAASHVNLMGLVTVDDEEVVPEKKM